MKKQIAFTFDDIPSYESLSDNPTAVIMKTLNDYGGKGTFFAVGSHIRKYGAAIPEQALKYGFELANHTDTHRNLTKLDFSEIENEIYELQNTVNRLFGIDMKYMRPPGLNVNETVFSVTKKLEMPVIFGSRGKADLSDWNPEPSAEHIKRRCLEGAYSGQIVLMHGYSDATAEVFGSICENLSREGYSFVTLSRLFEANGIERLPFDRPVFDVQSAY